MPRRRHDTGKSATLLSQFVVSRALPHAADARCVAFACAADQSPKANPARAPLSPQPAPAVALSTSRHRQPRIARRRASPFARMAHHDRLRVTEWPRITHVVFHCRGCDFCFCAFACCMSSHLASNTFHTSLVNKKIGLVSVRFQGLQLPLSLSTPVHFAP